MTSEEIANLVTTLSVDLGQYTQAMSSAVDKASETANGIQSSFAKTGAGAVAAGTLIANGVTAIASKLYSMGTAAVANFAEAEAGAIKLKAAIGARGGDVAATFADYDKFASSIQRLTVVDDDAVKGLLQQSEALGVTGNAAKRAAKNAVALQAARGISAQSAIRMTAALEQGNTSLLTRMLPSLRNAKTETEKMAMAQDLLGKMFKVAEAEAGSIKGAYAQMNNAISDTYEMICTFSAENLQLVDVMQFVRDGFGKVQILLPAVFEAVMPIINRVKTSLVGFFEGAMEKGTEFLVWAGPLFLEFGNVAITSIEGTVTIWMGAWGVIQDTVASVWSFISGSTETTFGDVKTFLLDAMITGEFALKHFDQVAALTWINTQLGFVSLYEDIKHFFTATMPELLSWLSENWQKVFFTVMDYTMTVFINLGQNIRNAMTAVWDFIASGGTKSLNLAWIPLEEGFVNAIDKLPELSERGMTELEKSLRRESETLADTMGAEFTDFYNERMGEINGNGLVASLTEAGPEVEDIASDIGDVAGIALGKGMKDGADIQGAAFGSTEALSRILATQEALRSGKVTALAANGGTTGGGGTASQATKNSGGGGASQNSKIEAYLKELVDLARAQAGQGELMKVEEAGLI